MGQGMNAGIDGAMSAKLRGLMDDMRSQFVEREEEIAGALLAMLSGEHVLFIGPPGTAKSQMAKVMCERLEGM